MNKNILIQLQKRMANKTGLHYLTVRQTAATCTVNYATTSVGASTISLCSTKSSLSSLYLYVTHMMNYSRPSTAFLYYKQWKARRGLGMRLGLVGSDQINQSSQVTHYLHKTRHWHCPGLASTSIKFDLHTWLC